MDTNKARAMNVWLSPYRHRIRQQRRTDWFMTALGLLVMLLSLGLLVGVVVNLVASGAQRLNSEFLFGFPSRFAEHAGILPAWVGSCLVLLCSAILSIPIGIGAAIYLEEYSRRNWLSMLMEINLFNLAGVPSIIYGLLGLSLLVYGLSMGQTILVAGLTLAALMLPMIILTTREALRTVPQTIREAAYTIGCDRWQTIWNFILPQAWSAILTGVMTSLSRALGEVAPLISLGVFSYVAFLPTSPFQSSFPWLSANWLQEPFNTLPLQMYNWLLHPQPGFHQDAAAAGLVLLSMTLCLNMLMMWVRFRLRRRFPAA